MSVPPIGLSVDAPLHPKSWDRPAGNHEFRVTQHYNDVNQQLKDDYNITVIHAGTDMGSGEAPGRNVYAPGAGPVLAEGWLFGPWSQASSTAQRANWNGSTNWGGIMTVIRLSLDYIWAGAHMKDTVVSKGQTVKAGQLIGHVGNTGAAFEYGTHLHNDLYRRLSGGELIGGRPHISYDGSTWVKVDLWPLLAQNYTVPDTAISSPKEDTMRFGGADLHVISGVPTYRLTANSNFRTGPGRQSESLAVIPAGTPMPIAYFIKGESIGGNEDWAMPFLYVGGGYSSGFIHSSLLEAIQQSAPAATGPTAEEVAVLVKQGRQAGARDTAKVATDYAAKQ